MISTRAGERRRRTIESSMLISSLHSQQTLSQKAPTRIFCFLWANPGSMLHFFKTVCRLLRKRHPLVGMWVSPTLTHHPPPSRSWPRRELPTAASPIAVSFVSHQTNYSLLLTNFRWKIWTKGFNNTSISDAQGLVLTIAPLSSPYMDDISL